MPDNFVDSINKSANMFEMLCVPELKKEFECDFISIENKDIYSHIILDTMAGIDAFAYKEGNGVIGVSSRIQYNKNWGTFTVRKNRESHTLTEFDKITKAIEDHTIYPFITIQAYIVNNELDGMAVCRTKRLYALIKAGECACKKTREDQKGQAWFYIVPWSNFKDNEIKIFTKENLWVNKP